MIVRIDEPRREHEATGIDDVVAVSRSDVTHFRNATVNHAQRPSPRRGTRAVDELGGCNDEGRRALCQSVGL